MNNYKSMDKPKAERIRELYFNRFYRYTQKELSQMFGMTQSSISRIVSGETR